MIQNSLPSCRSVSSLHNLHNLHLENRAHSMPSVTRDDNKDEHSSQSEVRLPAEDEIQLGPIQVETDKKSEDLELDKTILQILGEDPKKGNLQGDNIHQALANRCIVIIKKGFSQEVRKDLLQTYP